MKPFKCHTKYCKRKTETKGTRFCNVCRKRKSRANNQVKYAYQNRKDRAKQRGKHFDLTFDQFKEFCYEYDYLKGQGRKSTSYTIDCIVDELGYTKDNLQLLTLKNNAQKGKKILVYDWQTKEAYVYTKKIETNEDDYF